MGTTGVINGTNLLVYVNGEAIAGSKSCKFAMSHDVRDTFTKDDAGWQTYLEGKRSWNMSADGLVALDATNYSYSDLQLLIVNRTKVHLKFSTEASGDKWWYGDGYLKTLDMDAGNEESTSYSASFEGTGLITAAQHT